MCDCHSHPSAKEQEIGIREIEKLPYMKNVTITGGEPFIRDDLDEIVTLLEKKSGRILINTNGYYTDRMVELCRKHPKVGIRISIDGFKDTHNKIRGIDIYDHAMTSLEKLSEIRGKKDLGIGFTIQDTNYTELMRMYDEIGSKGYEFGIVVVHNSAYFEKADNKINSKDEIIKVLDELQSVYLKSKRPKDWMRAFFAFGEKQYVLNQKKPLHCDAGISSFFIDVYGDVIPCNGMSTNLVMGNLKEQTWEEIINSEKAKKVCRACRECKLNCWSVCNVSSALRKKIYIPLEWIIRNKFQR
jgi:radical SAM protein with 4Fe4S-binding SPASM domain